MADAQAYLITVLNEQYGQARQHENLRQQSTSLLLTLVAAVVALTTASATLLLKDLDGANLVWPFAFYLVPGGFLIAIGRFGRALSFKHYERNRLHVQRARGVRTALDDLAAVSTADILKKADCEHLSKMRVDHSGYGMRVVQTRTYKYWQRIFNWVILLGVVIMLLAAVGAVEASRAPPVSAPAGRAAAH